MSRNDILLKAPPIAPLHFFRLNIDIHHGTVCTAKKYTLPQTAEFLGEESFASVAISWHQSGLFFQFTIQKPFEEVFYPKYTQGDAIEIFIDTRNLKEAGIATHFCHQFLILPQEINSIRALEISRFKNGDDHPLCDPHLIETKTEILSNKFILSVHLPTEILQAYDPTTFNYLGFTYCIHRPKNTPCHFSVSSDYVAIAKHPSLWASCHLIP
jgi:hypothetical protein